MKGAFMRSKRSNKIEKRQKRTGRRLMVIVMVVCVLGGTVFLADKMTAWVASTPPQPGGNAAYAAKGEETSGKARQDTAAKGQDIDFLQLVNREHPLAREDVPAKTVGLMGTVPVSDKTVLVAESIVKPLKALFDAANKTGLPGLYVTSGYRSYEAQASLYERSADKSYVQPAGSSEHETGLAVDIAETDSWKLIEAGTDSGAWIAENAWRYGFILRYPQDKEGITGISYEPWHFRYVGKEAAKVCYEQKLCLEEYLRDYT
jgi:D-alanyl-D-alanine carboxypeptidase